MTQNLTYTRCGDYLIPDIQLSHVIDKPLGKYGRMHRVFLAENNPMLYDDMVLTETLFPHLWEIDDTYSEFLPTLNEGADRKNFDTFIEAFCNRTPGTTFLSYEETDQQLNESFAQIQMLAWGLILFVGLIGILNIINTVYTNIHTRVTEIGMQRAIGMNAEHLCKTFLWEGAYYGIIASVIRSVLGYVCTIFIEAATSDTIQFVAIPVLSILEATLLAVGACLLAAAVPLRKISKMSIFERTNDLSLRQQVVCCRVCFQRGKPGYPGQCPPSIDEGRT